MHNRFCVAEFQFSRFQNVLFKYVHYVISTETSMQLRIPCLIQLCRERLGVRLQIYNNSS